MGTTNWTVDLTTLKTSYNLPEGEYTVQAQTISNFGYTGLSPAAVFYVDTYAPNPPTISGPANNTNSTSATFTFSSSDTADSSGVSSGVASYDYMYSSDGGTTWTTGTTTKSTVKLKNLSSDGVYTFEVAAVDNAGNVSGYTSYTWNVDLTAPMITELSGPVPPDNWSNSATPTFNFSADDATENGVSSGVASFKYSIDGGTWTMVTNPITYTTSSDGTTTTTTASSSVTSATLSDGSHTFEVEAIDNAGNVSDAASYDWYVDSVAPTTTATPALATTTVPYAFGSWTNTAVSIQLSATDPSPSSGIAGTYYQIDNNPNGFTNYSSTGAFTISGAGEHTVSFYSTDNAGNVEATLTEDVDIDATAPTTTLNAYPASDSNSTSATFAFSSVDPTVNGASSGIASFEYSTDGGNIWTAVPNPITFTSSDGTITASSSVTLTGLTDGSQTFEVEAKDNAGNAGKTPSEIASYTWTVDTQPPTTTSAVTAGTSNPETGWYTSAVQVTITPSDPSPSSGLAATYYQIDGGTVQTTTSPSPFTIDLGDGTHTVTYNSTDNAGNTQATQTLTLPIDTTAPTVTVTGGPSNPSHAASASFTFSVSDATSGANPQSVQYSLDGGTWMTATSPVTLTVDSDGTHTFALRATDIAGNVGTSAPDHWYVDTATLTGASTATATGGTAGQNPASLSGATFTDSNTAAVATDFTVAAVDWGDPSDADNTDTSGLTVSGSNGSFTVYGSHVYSTEGSYNFRITVDDDGGVSTTITGSATVGAYEPLLISPFPNNGFTNLANSQFTTVTGTADPSLNVASIAISLENSAGDYWDGTAFSSPTQIFSIAATGTTSWTANLPPGGQPPRWCLHGPGSGDRHRQQHVLKPGRLLHGRPHGADRLDQERTNTARLGPGHLHLLGQ